MSDLSPTAERILDSARKLVVAGGYNGFSYADIADEVGIRKASIHHHFPSKADLVQRLVTAYRLEAASGLAGLTRAVDDPVRQLRAYIGYWQACIRDGSQPFCLCALLAGEEPLLPPAVAEEVRLHFKSLAAWLSTVLARGHAEGRFRLAGTVDAEALSLQATVHGAMLSARAFGDPATFVTITETLLDRLVARQ